MIFYVGITLGIVITSASALVIVLLRLNARRRQQAPAAQTEAAKPVRKWRPKFAFTGLFKKMADRGGKNPETTTVGSEAAPPAMIPADAAATVTAEAAGEPVPAADQVQADAPEPDGATAVPEGETPEPSAAVPEAAAAEPVSLADGIEAAFEE